MYDIVVLFPKHLSCRKKLGRAANFTIRALPDSLLRARETSARYSEIITVNSLANMIHLTHD